MNTRSVRGVVAAAAGAPPTVNATSPKRHAIPARFMARSAPEPAMQTMSA